MELISYRDCKSVLYFEPESAWPGMWPAFAWEKQLIAGFAPSSEKKVTIEEQSHGATPPAVRGRVEIPPSRRAHLPAPRDTRAQQNPYCVTIEEQSRVEIPPSRRVHLPAPRVAKSLLRHDQRIESRRHSSRGTRVVNFSARDTDFLSLFYACYPRLSLLELGRIVSVWQSAPEKPDFLWKDFFSLYGFSNADMVMAQIKYLRFTPLPFQDWVCQKDLHPSELRPLISLKDPKFAHPVCQWIAKHNLSRSLGVKALELWVELWLMEPDTKIEKLLHFSADPEKVIQAMEQKRKPVSYNRERTNARLLKRIIWPPHVNAQWHRKGDKTGLKLTIWCRNQKELEQKIKQISKTATFDNANEPSPLEQR